MSKNAKDVIEAVEGAVEEIVDAPKKEEMTIFGKVDRKIINARKAKAEKKQDKAKAKAEKKAKKDDASPKEKKKLDLKVVIPVTAVAVGAVVGGVVKVARDRGDNTPELEDSEMGMLEAPAEEPAVEVPAETQET